jgi:hypothetical protein
MYAIAIHQISDPEKFWGLAQELELPQGTALHTVAPNADGTRAVCVWESDSLDTVRDFVESAAGDISNNEFYEVNAENAVGLPAASVAAT